MIAEVAGPERVDAATGFAITLAQISSTIAPPLFGLVADITGRYRDVWLALLVMLVALAPAVMIDEDDEERVAVADAGEVLV